MNIVDTAIQSIVGIVFELVDPNAQCFARHFAPLVFSSRDENENALARKKAHQDKPHSVVKCTTKILPAHCRTEKAKKQGGKML
jgi:hypothetical protein